MPADLCGWWRGVAFSGIAWYAIDDLIAEIREETSNNRIKSGYANRPRAPIDTVPDAGARSGRPDGVETTDSSLAAPDIEEGLHSPLTPGSARTLSPPSTIPHLQV
ncbi:hypothetical protein EVG20_g5041 [Dentipellis fragilis]|uniref:Uncharacterized protein n=1 Tax=Dentipellis fragilis TaxID=205917 RepID=A0A4Y9YU04_9AGAM|nr:hypothetical protein EVG20_g5041 [Dentipellis fragilis]